MRPSNLTKRIQRRQASSGIARRRSTIALYACVGAALLSLMAATAASAAVPGIERTASPGDINSSDKVQGAPCPLGKRLLSAGGEITGGLGQVLMNGLTVGPVGAAVFGREDQDGTGADWFITAYTICADPLPDLEYVEATGPSNSRNKHITATCPAGKRVVGAGGLIQGEARKEVVMNGVIPNPELTKVTVRGAEDRDDADGDWFVRAHAVCANPLPGLQLVPEPSALDSAPSKFARARCPAGKVLVGLGGRISGGTPIAGQVVLDDLTPNAQLTEVTVTGFEAQGGTDGDWRVHAFAICATA